MSVNWLPNDPLKVENVWLLQSPFPLLLPSWEDAATHLFPTGSAYSKLFRHDDGFTLTHSQALKRSPRSGPESKAKWIAHTRMKLLTLTSLIKPSSQRSRCLCPKTKMRRQKYMKGKKKSKTHLALSILPLQARVKGHCILTEESRSCEHLYCAGVISGHVRQSHRTLSPPLLFQRELVWCIKLSF